MNERDRKRAFAYDDALACVKCGYCLPACPTYETMGTETHSPRGRIQLVKAAAEGKLSSLSPLSEAIDKCLGCLACQTACPSGVDYANLYESAKAALRRNADEPVGSPEPGSRSGTRPQQDGSAAIDRRAAAGYRTPFDPSRLLRQFLFRRALPSKRWMSALSILLWLYQASGMERLANRFGWTRRLPPPIAAFAGALPPQPNPLRRLSPLGRSNPTRTPALRVALFSGCVMDAMFARTNRLAARLLEAAGCEVVALPGETCCGALHAHAGEPELAKALAKRNIEAFEALSARFEVDYVVNAAGGCGAMLVEYGRLFRDEPAWRDRAEAFAAKNKDISYVLDRLGPLPFAADGRKPRPSRIVAYQPSCHMTNVQQTTAPLNVLRSLPDVELRLPVDMDKCCGSAGIYNLVHYRESMDILDVKMRHVAATEAAAIVTTNPGCLLQLRLGIEREGLQGRMRAVHLVDLLAEACGIT